MQGDRRAGLREPCLRPSEQPDNAGELAGAGGDQGHPLTAIGVVLLVVVPFPSWP